MGRATISSERSGALRFAAFALTFDWLMIYESAGDFFFLCFVCTRSAMLYILEKQVRQTVKDKVFHDMAGRRAFWDTVAFTCINTKGGESLMTGCI